MRIVFIGAVEFSTHCLEQVVKAGGDVVAVFTPTAHAARHNSDYSDVGAAASTAGIPVYQFTNINDAECVMELRGYAPDVIFVFGLSQMISDQILTLPPMGCIGTHPALLPKDRGRHPLIWSLVEGLEEGGLTFFYLEDAVDSGDIIWQGRFPIAFEDDARSLYDKMKNAATEGIAEFLPLLKKGEAQSTPQDDSLATYRRKRSEADGLIDWSSDSVTIYNLIRALARPYVGAHTFWGHQRITVWRSAPVSNFSPVGNNSNALNIPGQVISQTVSDFLVATGDGVLRIVESDGIELSSIPEGAIIGGRQ